MTDESPRDIDWPTRRWLLWGVVAIAGLAAAIFLVSSLGDGDAPPVGGEATGEQISWSINLADMAGQDVELRADVPLGTPTETWIDGQQLERGLNNNWPWNVDATVPQPVVDIDEAAGCDALAGLLTEWIEGVQAARGEAFNWQARAFTQHTLNTMRSQSCDVDPSTVTGL